MTNIYLARHGQNQDNADGILNGHRDEPLTELGFAQARTLAHGIQTAGITFDQIASSPLRRALDTARTVSDVCKLPEPIVLDILIERDFGIMTGKPAARIKELCAPDIIETDTITYFLSPEGAETFPQLLARATIALSQLQKLSNGLPLLAVCHGDFGKMLYAAHYELPWEEVLTGFHFGNAELLHLGDYGDHSLSHVVKLPQVNH